MSVIRLIHITIDPSEIESALQVWKKECAPLMIQQKGCISEKLLRCRDTHELISYSEWATEADISAISTVPLTKRSCVMREVSKDQRPW